MADQEFPRKAAKSLIWGKNLLFNDIFAENCLKLKEIVALGSASDHDLRVEEFGRILVSRVHGCFPGRGQVNNDVQIDNVLWVKGTIQYYRFQARCRVICGYLIYVYSVPDFIDDVSEPCVSVSLDQRLAVQVQ